MARPRFAALAAAGVALLCVGAIMLIASPAPAPQAAVSGAAVVVCGSIQHKSWSKTPESWDAGGSDYYTITLDGAHAGFDESMILRTPADESIGASSFAQWAGKHACAKGTLAESQPWVQTHPWEQFPVGAGGQPLPRGSGFVAAAIGRLKDVQ
ncbi:hypothetical protein T492DRAFT_1100571 [Pavlovales sp. CCMP2436]|nr:hypothetical protein T492DRAFT_1100571 [Pavlovales sp. CCMP2436]